MHRFLLSLAALCLFIPFANAQTDAASPTPTAIVQPPTFKLPPGASITDSKGRSVENGGTNNNGRVHIKHTGNITNNGNGTYTCSGEISEVTNPASQGSEGPITVNTNGEPTEVNLDRNGRDPGQHVNSTIIGGNATVNVSGNYNDPTVGGTNNTVNITGNHNSGQGQGAGSGGTVNMGGRDNGWNSNGGNWNVRN